MNVLRQCTCGENQLNLKNSNIILEVEGEEIGKLALHGRIDFRVH